MADAALGAYFDPPPTFIDEHGMTVTWEAEHCKELQEAFGFAGPRSQPEAVHAPAPFRLLRVPAVRIPRALP